MKSYDTRCDRFKRQLSEEIEDSEVQWKKGLAKLSDTNVRQYPVGITNPMVPLCLEDLKG